MKTSHILRFVARPLGVLCALVFVVLLGDVLWGVLTRYVFGHQANWTEELARFLLVWLTFLGAALAYVGRQHLGVDVLVARFDPVTRRLADALGHAVVGIFAAAIMGWGGWELFRERLASGQTLPALGIAKAWQYLALPVSGLLMACIAALHFTESLRCRETAPDTTPAR